MEEILQIKNTTLFGIPYTTSKYIENKIFFDTKLTIVMELSYIDYMRDEIEDYVSRFIVY